MRHKEYYYYFWALFYKKLYLEKKMHGHQFNHGSWCLKNFKNIEIIGTQKLSKKYETRQTDISFIGHFSGSMGVKL